MAKTALVPIANGTEEIEAACIIDTLRRAGIEVTNSTVGAVQVTASHNPAEFNGLKLQAGMEALAGPELQKVERLIASGAFASGEGSRLARDVVEEAGAETRYEMARAIEAHIRQFDYDLDLEPPPLDTDFVDYFLFTAQRGYCDYSATAMVVMLRSLGVAARGIVPAGTDEDHVLLNMVRAIMPAGGYMLLMVVSISVIMSSLDSLLNAGAVVFTQDIVRPVWKVANGKALDVGRTATVVIALAAAAAAAAVPTIIDGLLVCYTIWAPAILPALVLGLWLKKPRPLAGILSMVVGALVAGLSQLAVGGLTTVPAILPALGAAILAYVVGHLLSREKGA